MVIDTKIVEIRKPQVELAETMRLCQHLPHLLHHRHMVTPPRAFVKFWSLPNYLSVTNLNKLEPSIMVRSSFFWFITLQRSTGPIQNEQSLFCAVSEACEVVWIDISTKTFDKTSSLLVSPPWLSTRRRPSSSGTVQLRKKVVLLQLYKIHTAATRSPAPAQARHHKTARPGRGCSLVLSSGRSADHRTLIINYNERGRHHHLETQAGRRKLRRKEEEDEWCASFIVN